MLGTIYVWACEADMVLDTPGSLDNYQGMVAAFAEFLTVAIHLILFERKIYPRASFLRTRKYDAPVQQNRHPKVCRWIAHAVEAVGAEMLKCTVRQTSLVLYSSDCVPLERYVFSTDLFPIVERDDVLVPFYSADNDSPQHSSSDDSRSSTPTPQASGAQLLLPQETDTALQPHQEPIFAAPTPDMLELTSQFAAVLSRISAQAGKLPPLPPKCRFNLAIELRDPPVGLIPIDGATTNWLPAEPGLQPAAKKAQHARPEPDHSGPRPDVKRLMRGEYLGGSRTLAVRSVEAGPFVMQTWLEENHNPGGSSGRAMKAPTKRRAHFADEAAK